MMPGMTEHARSPVQPRTWRWMQPTLRFLGVSLGLAVAIALLLTAALPSERPPLATFAVNAVYAFCIGSTIQLLVEGGRRWLARLVRAEARTGSADWPGWRWFGPWLLIASALGYAIGAGIADLALQGRHLATLVQGDLRAAAFLAVLTLMVSLLTSLALLARARADAAQARREQLERQAVEQRLRRLQAQLEPHMLFNTLANLKALVQEDPARAEAMLDHLIGFLRGTLGASRALTHPLQAEFARLEDYLALMSIRMGDRLRFELDLPAELADVPVPPLLLQPLAENAIRHGLEPCVDGGTLWIAARASGAELRLTVRDDGVGLRPANRVAGDGERSGFGNEWVREQLSALYGQSAALSCGPGLEGRGCVAVLRLPLADATQGQTSAMALAGGA